MAPIVHLIRITLSSGSCVREVLGDEARRQASEAPREGARAVNGRLTITDVAGELGVSVKTILRWEKAGKIRRARRDWRGWRVYVTEDVTELKTFFEAVY